MKKTTIAFCLMICLLFFSSNSIMEGLLPSLTDVFCVPMPSLGDVLHRYPDTEMEDTDGSTVQTWKNVKNADFEAFSEYLSTVGTVLLDYAVTDGIFTANIGKNDQSFTFVYDTKKQIAEVIYPKGTYDERSCVAESYYNEARQLMSQGNYMQAIEAFNKIEDSALYKDVDNLLKKDDNLIAAARLLARAGRLINRYAVVNVDNLPIRPNNNTKELPISRVKEGTYVWAVRTEMNEKDEYWTEVYCQVKYTLYHGYIMSEYLDILSAEESNQYNIAQPTPVPRNMYGQ